MRRCGLFLEIWISYFGLDVMRMNWILSQRRKSREYQGFLHHRMEAVKQWRGRLVNPAFLAVKLQVETMRPHHYLDIAPDYVVGSAIPSQRHYVILVRVASYLVLTHMYIASW